MPAGVERLVRASAVLLVCLVGAGPASNSRSVRVELSLGQGAQGTCSGSGTLRAEPVDAEPESTTEAREWRFRGPSVLELALDSRVTWELSLEAAGCWAQPRFLAPEDATEILAIELLPAGISRGQVRAPRGEDLPESLSVRFQSLPSTGEEAPAIPKLNASCPILEGSWECELPSAELDLRLVFEGYVPHYFWNVPIPVGEAFDMGSLRLERGASLIGWVRTSDRGANLEKLALMLIPETLGEPTSERGRLRSLEASPNRRGFFELRPVPPGVWALEVGEGSGYSPQRVAPIRIDEEIEISLEPIELERLARLEVVLAPPLDPHLEPWEVRLRKALPMSRLFKDVTNLKTSSSGYWIQDELEKGVYDLTIRDSRGAAFHRREIQVEPGMVPLEIDLPGLLLEGTLSIGDEPIAAEVVFRDDSGRRATFTASDDGLFEGFLPSTGEWRVQVSPGGQSAVLRLGPVEVIDDTGEGIAYVDLSLPATRLTGLVVDEEDDPVAEALVKVFRGDRLRLHMRTESDGRFEVLGLSPGALEVQAEVRGAFSDLTAVELEEDEEPSIELVLRSTIRFAGRISTDRGSVPGALVRYQGQGSRAAGEAISGPSGEYSFNLPASTTEVVLVVLAPGLSRKIVRAAVRAGARNRADVTIDSDGGILSIAFLPPKLGTIASGIRLSLGSQLLVHDGAVVPLFWVLDPGRSAGFPNLDLGTGRIQLSMSSGSYALCAADQLLADCSQGYLQPGGMLMLAYSLPGTEKPATEATSRQGI